MRMSHSDPSCREHDQLNGFSCCLLDSPPLFSQSWASLGLLTVTEQLRLVMWLIPTRPRCLWKVVLTWGLLIGVVKTFSQLSWIWDSSSTVLFSPPLLRGQTFTMVKASPCLLRSSPFTDSSPDESPACVILGVYFSGGPKWCTIPFPRRYCPSYHVKPFQEIAWAYYIFHIYLLCPSAPKWSFLRIPIEFGTSHLALIAYCI